MVVLQHLRRVRWAVRATLFLGVAASVVANVLHALDNPISQAIAAWPPLALLLTVELISRVPVHRRWLAATRLLATATIAGIAAWVSYWHMAGVAARYGETGASPYLLPLSVDGLIVVASICLVELGGRISTLESETTSPAVAGQPAASSAAQGATLAPQPATASARPSAVAWPVASVAAGPEAGPDAIAEPIPSLIPAPPMATPIPVGAGQRSRAAMDPRARTEIAAALSHSTGEMPAFTPPPARQPRQPATAGRAVPAQRSTAASRAATSRAVPAAKKERRSPAETVALANRIKAERPSLTEAEIAAELGISASRWRTVRREADTLAA
ncbi:DUF2637 domain-containing protein [Actinoplanes sp. CA-142083]|uniref:DUF2637 domain-containing protein n=1 Tax=Actinoplanes sp. CA-142083 TaxID=3239903 RepID=UPI003D91274C